MAWNHRSRVIAMAVAIQVSAGTFIQPNTTTDLIAGSSITNSHEAITAEDPTATGAIWEGNRVYLGKVATVGATLPLRGPGGATPPALNAFVPGRIMQSAGWAEIRKAAANTGALAAVGTATTLTLANTESAVDDFLVGAPIQHTVIGTGFKQTSLVTDYVGSTKVATLGETMGSNATNGSNYTIPAYLSYVLGTLTTAPPVLSISVWRDKKRYDYRDWAPTSLAVNIPVGNEANTGFPDITFSGRATVQAIVDEASPILPSSILAIPVPPARNGKFYLDRVKLGHQSLSFTESATVAAQSNQNQAAGQDAYDILSGSRATAIDLNQMAVTDFDLHAREDAQTVVPVLSTWGAGSGNNWGFVQPAIALDPFSPGDRNGYVSITGNAVTIDIDKSAALTLWW
jgi:hypothetical protein